MILANATVIDQQFQPQKCDLQMQGEIITKLGANLKNDQIIDLTDCYILPGFIDTHIHGAYGTRISDAAPDMAKITEFEATQATHLFNAMRSLHHRQHCRR